MTNINEETRLSSDKRVSLSKKVTIWWPFSRKMEKNMIC